MGITNMYLGWVFLVDDQARVRWHAHGTALPDEIHTMLRLTETLEQRRIHA